MSAARGARVTFSTASGRRRARGVMNAFDSARIVPIAAACAVALVAGLLVYSARSASLGGVVAAMKRGEVLDLGRVRKASAIESELESVFSDRDDREFAAAEILKAIRRDGTPSPPANVGALAMIRVPAAPLAQRSDLDVYQRRAAAAIADRAHADAKRRGARDKRPVEIALLTPEQLRDIKSAFVVRAPSQFHSAFWLSLLLIIGSFVLMHVAAHVTGRSGDRFLLPAGQILAGIGFAMSVSLRDPLRDQMLFARFAQGVALGAVAFALASLPDYPRSVLRRLWRIPLAAALLLALLLVVLGQGPSGSDARVNLFGVQPVEIIRLLLVLFLAGWFAERWQFLRELHEPPLGASPLLRLLKLPRLRHALPVAIGVAASIAFFFLQRDLGPALILLALFLCLYAVSRGGVVLALAGLGAVVLAFVVGHLLHVPATVSLRTSMWLSPWENGRVRGDQVAHSLWSFAAGGTTGTGLGLGLPALAPAAHTDLILAAIGEELGFVGVLACLALLALIVVRGFRIARRAPDAYALFLALGLTVAFALQALLIAGGVLGLVPLSGVVTPFLSYGRSALILNFLCLGVLWSLSASSDAQAQPQPQPQPQPQTAGAARAAEAAGRPFAIALDPQIRALAMVFAVLGGIVIVKAAWVQVARADATLGRGSLAQQADGELRYQYNPRLLAVGASVPRGAILDRNGVVLATSRWTDLVKQRDALALLGIDLDAACRRADPRHYPFGGVTYHLLGDYVSRRNWGASNTMYLERNEDAFLSGYDDHSRVVSIKDPRNGRKRRVVRRNLAELVPLWRHRHDPKHPAVAKFLARSRDVRTTIDVRLQLRASQLLRRHLERDGLLRGAVVVVDASKGDVLASASWPAPGSVLRGGGVRIPADDSDSAAVGPLFDRARYGLYPPGSTFKVVTAAAALEQDPELANATFTCQQLPDNRVGAIVDGKMVRDDPTDPVHGTIAMEEAIVVSCNAYFAQLARRIGWARLEGAADRLGIDTGNPRPRERPAHLLEAAYGQAHVVASPLQMARVAATIGNAGALPAPRWTIAPADSAGSKAVFDAATAATVGRAMRGVVERGTAMRLASVQPPVAGKTGTAQVANQPSHSWFIGYAPSTAGGRRIAFAVLLENGGYGGVRAATLAADVVAAARDLGLMRAPAQP